LGLDERGLDYVVEVEPTASAYPADAAPAPQPYSGRGRPPKPDYPHPPTNLEHLALAAGRGALHTVTWRHGSRHTADNPSAAMRSRFRAIRLRPATRHIPRQPDGSLPEVWLIAEWPTGQPKPVKYWLSNMPSNTPLKTLVRIGKIRWRVEHDYREL